MKLEEIAAEAYKLPEAERAVLAAHLLHGLESPKHAVTDEEVARRKEEAEADPSVLVSFEEIVSGLKHRVR